MSDLDQFTAMLTRAGIPHNVGLATKFGAAATRVEIIEQNRPWTLAATFTDRGQLLSLGTWIPPGKEHLIR